MSRVLALILVFLLAACTSGRTTTLRWAVGGDAGSIATFRSLAERFEAANPDLRVQIEALPPQTNFQHRYFAATLGAGGIDLLGADVIWTAEFAERGWVRSLDAYMPASERTAFMAPPMESVTYRGRLWGVPMFTDLGVLFYRKDLLEKYGYRPPRTWEELAVQARRIGRAEGIAGFLWQGVESEGLVCNALEWTHGAGGGILDPQGRIVVDSPETRRAWTWMATLPGGISPPQTLEAWEETGRIAFVRGEAVFLRNWPYVWASAQDPASRVRGKVGVAPIPGFAGHPSAPTLGGWNLMMAAKTRHPDATWRLLSYLTGEEAQTFLATRSGRLPTRHAVYARPEVRRQAPLLATLYPQALQARPRPMSPAYPEVSRLLQAALTSVLTGQQAPEAAIRDTERRLQALTLDRTP